MSNTGNRSFAGVSATVLGFALIASWAGMLFSDDIQVGFGVIGSVIGLVLAIRSRNKTKEISGSI